MKRIIFSVAVASIALIGAAQAQTIGTATTDLNLRWARGPNSRSSALSRLARRPTSSAASMAACGVR